MLELWGCIADLAGMSTVKDLLGRSADVVPSDQASTDRSACGVQP